MGSDGEVYHERTTKKATPAGRDDRIVHSGDPAACENATPTGVPLPGFLGSGSPINVETGNVRILSPGDDYRGAWPKRSHSRG